MAQNAQTQLKVLGLFGAFGVLGPKIRKLLGLPLKKRRFSRFSWHYRLFDVQKREKRHLAQNAFLNVKQTIVPRFGPKPDSGFSGQKRKNLRFLRCAKLRFARAPRQNRESRGPFGRFRPGGGPRAQTQLTFWASGKLGPKRQLSLGS